MITITAIDVRLHEGDQVRGYVTLTIDGSFVVRGIKIIQGADGHLFTAMPSRKRPDGTYQDIAHPISPAARQAIEDAVQAEYFKTLTTKAHEVQSTEREVPSACAHHPEQ